MADETHKLQKDPPEGSRKVIEHELKRQARKDQQAPENEQAPEATDKEAGAPGGR